ncbi:MAG TPA: hypothetical protein VGR31_09580 [Planctomycetota bacterium]|jgi:hypothetical protein|nr:hypothetical protein [Planctomycetota bacterium]
MAVDERFQEYFAALDRSGHEDRCYVCRRTSAEVKRFFGFGEDGVPLEAQRHGLEDVVLAETDIMSYRGLRPVCAVCQLNLDALFVLGEHDVLLAVLREMEERREHLWPPRA